MSSATTTQAVCVKHKEFLLTSLGISAKYFLGVGPLIAGLYVGLTSGGGSNGPMGLALILFVIAGAYVVGLLPALITATAWYLAVFVISYMHVERLLKAPLAFLWGSFLFSGLVGFGAQLFAEHLMRKPSNNTWAEVGAIAGSIAGFMAANGVLGSVETQPAA